MDLARALPHLADLLSALGRGQEAEEVRRREIRLYETLKASFPEDPEHPRNLVGCYLNLAWLLCEAGRQAEAAELFRKALRLEGANARADNDLAWYLATSPHPSLRDRPRAVRLAKKITTAHPDAAVYRNTLGVAYYSNGEFPAAVAELEKSMSMDAGGTSFDWFFLAMAHSRMGDRGKARAWFDRAVEWMDKHKPHDTELRRFRAEAHAMLTNPRPG
jgi:tetratricopeptide (TPR) repeat protein